MKRLAVVLVALALSGCSQAVVDEKPTPQPTQTTQKETRGPYKGLDGKVHLNCVVDSDDSWSSINCPDSYAEFIDSDPTLGEGQSGKGSYFYKGKWHKA